MAGEQHGHREVPAQRPDANLEFTVAAASRQLHQPYTDMPT
jgi:hypothetical protein